MYTNKKNERETDTKGFSSSSYSSTKQGSVMKRLLMLLMIAICLTFAGTQAAPITQASDGCELVCGEPYIDPNDGQCYQVCCPTDPQCTNPCELRLCKAGS
jgi:hypothetical protein